MAQGHLTRVRRPRAGITPGLAWRGTGVTFRKGAAPAGPPPAEVLRDNPDQFPRSQQSYHHPITGTPGKPTAFRFPPVQAAMPNTSLLNSEVRALDIGDGTKRRLATLTPDEQNRLVRGAVTAGLPQTDETYSRLLDSQVAAAITPGEPYSDQEARDAAEQHSEAPTPPEYILPTFIPQENAHMGGDKWGPDGPPTLDERRNARSSLLQATGTEAPEPTEEEIDEEVASMRAEED